MYAFVGWFPTIPLLKVYQALLRFLIAVFYSRLFSDSAFMFRHSLLRRELIKCQRPYQLRKTLPSLRNAIKFALGRHYIFEKRPIHVTASCVCVYVCVSHSHID